MMRLVFFYIFVVLIFFACAKDGKIPDKSESTFPSGFINPTTKIDVDLDQETDELLETLTTYRNTIQYRRDCYDEKADICEKDRPETVETKIYFEIDANNQKLIVVKDHNISCNCKTRQLGLVKSMDAISLDQIASIDTMSFEKDYNGNKVTSLIIKPKYDNKVIDSKFITTYLNKDKKIIYDTVSDKTNNGLFIEVHSQISNNLKNTLERLIQKYNKNYLVKENSYTRTSYHSEILQPFNLDEYYKVAIAENNIGSVGCFYSNSLNENSESTYSYIDDYDNTAVVKFDNEILEFRIISSLNNDTNKDGYLEAVNGDYMLKLKTKPHFKNGEYDFSEAIIEIENRNSKKVALQTMYGYCGC